MTTFQKSLVVTIAIGVPAFFLGRIIWPDPPGIVIPTTMQLILFMGIAAIESLAFGGAIAFLLFAPSMLKKQTRVFWSLAWLLGNWWPHDNFHRMIGMNLNPLIAIEYAFHATLVIATVIVVRFVIQKMNTR